jgi:hypothetical protein
MERLDRLLHVLPDGPDLLKAVPHMWPERSKLDAAGALPFLTRKILKVAVEVFVGPNGKLGHGL